MQFAFESHFVTYLFKYLLIFLHCIQQYDIEHPPTLNIEYPLAMDEGVSEKILQLDKKAQAEEAEAQRVCKWLSYAVQ